MEEWKEYRLGDILTISSGLAYKGEYLGKGDSLLLGMGCVSYTEQFLEKGMRSYSGDYDIRYSVNAGDIVLATRQQSDNLPILGMPAIIPQKFNGIKMVFGANLYKVNLKSKDFTNSFLYWLLKTPAYVHHIKSFQTGTTVRMITKADIEDYTFTCPNKKEREKISNILWNIEKKIELNRRINENLEEQAQALFRSWFVDFEPFGGVMPQDWKEGVITDLAQVTMGQSPESDSYNTDGVGDIFYQGCTDFGDRFPSIRVYTTSPTRFAEPFSSLLSVRAPVGALNVAWQKCAIGRGIASIKSIYNGFVYYSIQSYRPVLEGYNGDGTVFGCIKKSIVENIPILIPNTKVLEDFESKISPIDKQIFNNFIESQRLAELRDTLLPRLMSGELKINERNI